MPLKGLCMRMLSVKKNELEIVSVKVSQIDVASDETKV